MVAEPAGWLRSHARQMFQTEQGPAASSSLPCFALRGAGKQGPSFCPGQLSGPGGGVVLSPDPRSWPSPGKEFALWPRVGVGDGGSPQILHPDSWTHRRALSHSAATGAEPSLGEAGKQVLADPAEPPPPSRGTAVQPSTCPRGHRCRHLTQSRHSHTQPHSLPTGTQATPGHMDVYAVVCSHGSAPDHGAPCCHTFTATSAYMSSSLHVAIPHRHSRPQCSPTLVERRTRTLGRTATSGTHAWQRCHSRSCF